MIQTTCIDGADGSANTARPQKFAIHGEYAVASEGLGSNNAA